MHVFINEQEIIAAATPGATVGEIVEASRMHCDPSAIVTEIELDGVAFHAGAEEQYARRAATGVRASRSAPARRRIRRRQTPRPRRDARRRRRADPHGGDLLRESNTRIGQRPARVSHGELRLTLLLDYQLCMLAEDALSTIAREEIATSRRSC